MKKVFILSGLLTLAAFNAQTGNTGINTTSPKATLDVNLPTGYTNGQLAGVTIPQLTGDQVEAMSATAGLKVGTIVYATTISTAATKDITTVGYWYWKDTTDKWEPFTLGTSANGNTAWALKGNAGTDGGANNFIGTTDDKDLVFKRQGVQAGLLNTSLNNSSFGVNSLKSNTTGNNNTAIGSSALAANTTGGNNTALGVDALIANTIGAGNVAVGSQALQSNIRGELNTAIGYSTLASNIAGVYNTAIGSGTLVYNKSAHYNTAIGALALEKNTDGTRNTAIGMNSLNLNNTGSDNTATGFYALPRSTTGKFNTANGRESLAMNTTGDNNTAIGANASYSNEIGTDNTATGFNALYNNKASGNTAYGSNALFRNVEGDNNTAIGYKAYYTEYPTISTGRNNIVIGANSLTSSNTVSNEVTIGNSSNNVYRMYAASWTNASDRKLKHDIVEIPVGLNFVKALKPVSYIYNNNTETGTKTLGFVAQDIQETMRTYKLGKEYGLVNQLDKDNLGLNTTELIPVLTKAIQEQQKQIEELQSYKKENEDLKKRLEVLEAKLK